jgi:hypothetical protein
MGQRDAGPHTTTRKWEGEEDSGGAGVVVAVVTMTTPKTERDEDDDDDGDSCRSHEKLINSNEVTVQPIDVVSTGNDGDGGRGKGADDAGACGQVLTTLLLTVGLTASIVGFSYVQVGGGGARQITRCCMQ